MFIGILCLGILGIAAIIGGKIIQRRQQQIEDDPAVQAGITFGPSRATRGFATFLIAGGAGLVLLFLVGIVQMISWILKGLVAW